MANTNDIGKIVSLIMENPHIIEEISALAKGGAEPATVSETPPTQSEEPTPTPIPTSAPVIVNDTKRARREGLISALRPYLSEERARAVDSMMQVASILELMRR